MRKCWGPSCCVVWAGRVDLCLFPALGDALDGHVSTRGHVESGNTGNSSECATATSIDHVVLSGCFGARFMSVPKVPFIVTARCLVSDHTSRKGFGWCSIKHSAPSDHEQIATNLTMEHRAGTESTDSSFEQLA